MQQGGGLWRKENRRRLGASHWKPTLPVLGGWTLTATAFPFVIPLSRRTRMFFIGKERQNLQKALWLTDVLSLLLWILGSSVPRLQAPREAVGNHPLARADQTLLQPAVSAALLQPTEPT